MLPRWLYGLAVGALALFVANWALANLAEFVAAFTAALDLTKIVIGFVTLAAGLGTLSIEAAKKNGGIAALSVQEVSGGASLAVVGALLLAL
jgi:multisubunit Na+/H+ antiporter MnhC subunit